jgi:hypothetical protein
MNGVPSRWRSIRGRAHRLADGPESGGVARIANYGSLGGPRREEVCVRIPVPQWRTYSTVHRSRKATAVPHRSCMAREALIRPCIALSVQIRNSADACRRPSIWRSWSRPALTSGSSNRSARIPLERSSGAIAMLPEISQSMPQICQCGDIIRRQDSPLHNGEMDLNPVEPA